MKALISILLLLLIAGGVRAQDSSVVTRDSLGITSDTPKVWTLQECLDYAQENNIQLKQSMNTYLSGMEDTEAAKAAMLPSLSASVSQGLVNYP